MGVAAEGPRGWEVCVTKGMAEGRGEGYEGRRRGGGLGFGGRGNQCRRGIRGGVRRRWA